MNNPCFNATYRVAPDCATGDGPLARAVLTSLVPATVSPDSLPIGTQFGVRLQFHWPLSLWVDVFESPDAYQ